MGRLYASSWSRRRLSKAFNELVCRDLAAAVGHAMCVRQPSLMALALALEATKSSAVQTRLKCAHKQQAELWAPFSSIEHKQASKALSISSCTPSDESLSRIANANGVLRARALEARVKSMAPSNLRDSKNKIEFLHPIRIQ